MKKILFSLMLLTFSLNTMAVPADRRPRQLRLTDGSEITAYCFGDEHYSWFQNEEGYVIEPAADGLFRLTDRSADDEVQRLKAARASSHSALRAPQYIGSRDTAPLVSTGSPRVPVILVNFTDSVFTVGTTPEEINHYYDLYCNGTRDGQHYQGHSSHGSIRDYFVDQSDGAFTPEFVIIGPVDLPESEKYYTSHKSELTSTAIEKATAAYSGSWSDFDSRQLNQVDMVFIIFAGCGANTTGDRDHHIWPYESTSSYSVTMTDGQSVKVMCTGCCSEMSYSTRTVKDTITTDGGNVVIVDRRIPYTQPDGIGVMCHEISHALGLPDFYDTNYKAFGMDVWSLMDYGCYVSNGRWPCAFTSYERDFLGWRPLQTVVANGEITLLPIEQGGMGYKIVNDENPNEYYVIENRQKAGWDGALANYGHGLQVTHVDYDQAKWFANRVNADANHQCMTIIAANNMYLGSTALQNGLCTAQEMVTTWAGNLYPFVGDGIHNDSLTATSTPAATVYSASGFMNKDLHAIRENDDKSVTLYVGNDYTVKVDEVKAESHDACIYDLSGRRVAASDALRPGIYVRDNGKRFVKR